MESPLVSVCMITYNHEAFVGQAIESVLSQKTTFPFELVIGEDQGSDQTGRICREFQERYPDRIRLRLNEKNLGIIPNFFKTLQECKGRYVAICEGDDYWTDPNKLAIQVKTLEEDPESILCFHPVEVLAKRKIKRDPLNEETPEKTSIEDLVKKNFIRTCSAMFRNTPEVYQGKNLLKTGLGDYYLFMMLGQYGDFRLLKNNMAVYREQVEGSWSSDPHGTKRKSGFLTYKALIQDLSKINTRVSYLLLRRIFNFQMAFEAEKMPDSFLDILKGLPLSPETYLLEAFKDLPPVNPSNREPEKNTKNRRWFEFRN